MTLRSLNNFENLGKKSQFYVCNQTPYRNYSDILEIPQEVFIKVLHHLEDKKDIVQIFNALSVSKAARKTQSFTTICRYLFMNVVVDTIRVENILSMWSPSNNFARYVPVNICEASNDQFQSSKKSINVFFDVYDEADFTWDSHSIYPPNSLFIKYYDLHHLVPFKDYIQSITIRGKYNKCLNVDRLKYFVDSCPNLTHYGSEIPSYTHLKKGLTSFAYVSVNECLMFTDSFFKNLRSVHITFNNQIFNSKNKKLVPVQIDLGCFPILEKLCIVANNDIKLSSKKNETFPRLKKLFLYSRKKNGTIDSIDSRLFPNLVSLFLFAEKSPFNVDSERYHPLEFKKLKHLYYRCMDDLPKHFAMPHISDLHVVSSPVNQLPSNLEFEEIKSLKINNFSVYSRVELLNHPWDFISDMAKLLSKLKNFKSLTYLNLSNSLISEFIVNIKNFPNLKILDLSLNPISTFQNISESNVLQELNLNRTNIQTIDYDLKLPMLTKLSLKGTEVSELKNISHLRQLKFLDFSVTIPIENIEQIVDLQKLETLLLIGSKIANLSPIFDLSELKQLDLTKSVVNSLQNISKLQKLEDLKLSRIDDLMPIFSVKSLKNLSLNIWTNHQQKNMSNLINLKTLTVLNQSLYNFSSASNLTFMKSDKKLIAKFLKYFAPESLEIINLPYGEHGINVTGWSCFKNMMVKDSIKYGKFQRWDDSSSVESIISSIDIPLVEMIEI